MSTIAAAPAAERKPLYASLFVRVLVALILGIVLGVVVPDFAISLKILSDAFLKLISMIVAPIVFCVVVHGIAGAGDLKKVGRGRRQGAGTGHQHAAVLRRSPAGAGGLPDHVKGRAWRTGLGDRDPGRDAERGAEHSGDWPRAGVVGRLVHRHGPCSRQPHRQLRGHLVAAWEGDLDRAKAAKVLEGGELVDVTAG